LGIRRGRRRSRKRRRKKRRKRGTFLGGGGRGDERAVVEARRNWAHPLEKKERNILFSLSETLALL